MIGNALKLNYITKNNTITIHDDILNVVNKYDAPQATLYMNYERRSMGDKSRAIEFYFYEH